MALSSKAGVYAPGAFLLCVLTLNAGCSPGTGTVSGKVTFKGEALPGGMVTITPLKVGSTAFQGQIQPDGSYSVQNIPVGEAKVIITTQPPLGKIQLLGPYVKIPDRYRDAEKSGFSVKVERGDNKLDLPLEE
jgi:hypothetical protein